MGLYTNWVCFSCRKSFRNFPLIATDAIEERFITIGLDAFGQILVVVYTWRDDEIRLISARKATRTERQQYMEK